MKTKEGNLCTKKYAGCMREPVVVAKNFFSFVQKNYKAPACVTRIGMTCFMC